MSIVLGTSVFDGKYIAGFVFAFLVIWVVSSFLSYVRHRR